MKTEQDKSINTAKNNPSNLVKLAKFIDKRKYQMQALKQKKLIKNSLSNDKYSNKSKTDKKEIINELFEQIHNQLQEGHTILELKENQLNTIDIETLINALWQGGWDCILNNNEDTHLTNTNKPIIIKPLINNNKSKNEKSYIFWLHRHWYAEQSLAKNLINLAKRSVETFDFKTINLNENDKSVTPNEKQQRAIIQSSQHALSIIIGGPGTGKTFTVAKLVTTLQKVHEQKRSKDSNLPPLSITLTAPTGKAAQRMQESLQKSLQDEDITLDNAKTLHRLLGIGKDGIPRYNVKNPLPDDLIIVDEASMLGLELASQLVNAIKPTGRLIILGDANQLAAVDAGSVLADLCQVPLLQPYITELTESKRFDEKSKVGQFARAIQKNLPSNEKIQSVFNLLKMQDLSKNNVENKIPFYDISVHSNLKSIYSNIAQPYHDFFNLMQNWYSHAVNIFEAENRKKLFEVFDSYRILCAGHQGGLGTQTLNQQMSMAFTSYTKITRTKSYFYHGLPIIIQNNDYQLGLFNGDIGICILYQGHLYACFAEKVIPIQRLSRESCDYAYAMTIHKSQGSEFDNVAVCIDKAHTRLLSQELIYTAVTRSKSGLTLYSPQESLEMAILQKGIRQTGLQLQFQALKN